MKKTTPTNIQKRKKVEPIEQELEGRKKVSVKKTVVPTTSTKKERPRPITTKPKSTMGVENYKHGLFGDFMFNGSARKSINSENNNSFTLTPIDKGVGSVFTKEMIDIGSGFKCNFKFQMIKVYGGSDGLAFVIQNSTNKAINGARGDLGYNGMNGGLIAVEFDVFKNVEFINGPVKHHISIQTRDDNGLLNTDRNKSIGSHSFNQCENDDCIVPVEIIYDNTDSTIKVFLSQNGSLDLIIDSTIPYKLPSSAFIGFTGSTGFNMRQNIILDFTFEVLNVKGSNSSSNNKERIPL